MVGSHIGPYRVLRRVGQGGMGEVYLAQDESLHRQVAIKILPAAHQLDPQARKRLVREAQAAAALDHPFICKIYEVGEHDGHPFIAMEYVEGATLAETLERERMPIGRAIGIAGEIAEALESAHRRGVIHRDLKPANIMIGANGHAKVMDFGVAKRIAGTAGEPGTATALTAEGDTTGTLAYMSPEQLRGADLDARSDVFSFGVVLYQMLTAQHPFLRASHTATAAAILNDPHPPLNRYLPNPSPLLEHVLTRLLAKDPEQRHQSLHETRLELVNLEPSKTARALTSPASPRRRWMAAVAALTIVAAAGIATVSGILPMPFRGSALAFQERDWILITDVENLTGDPVFDRSLRLALEVGIAQSKYVNVFPRDRVSGVLQRMNRSGVERLDESLASDIAQREGNIRVLLVGSIAQLEDVYSITARVVDPYSRLAVITESVQAEGKARVLDALDDLSVRVRRKLGESLGALTSGRLELPKATTSSLEALKLYAEAVRGRADNPRTSDALLRQAVALDPEFALAHAELGRRYYLSPDSPTRQAGEEHFRKALARLDRLSGRERLWIEASVEDSRGNRLEAAERFSAYLEQYPDDSSAWFRLGWTYMAGLSRFDKAIEAFNRVAVLNPSEAGTYINLATCHSGLEDYRTAVSFYDKAFSLNRSFRLDMFINHEYGFTLVKLGRLDDAATVFAEMKAQPEPYRQARGARSAALLEMLRGRYSAAIAELRHVVLIHETGDPSVSEYRDRLLLATAYDATGDAGAAREQLRAVDRLISRLTLGPEWLRFAVTARARRGDIAAARRILSGMKGTAGDPTADSSTNRNAQLDQAQIDFARGIVDLAEGRTETAVPLLESAHLRLKNPESLHGLAAAYLAGGRLDEAAARYEELLTKRPFGFEAQELWLRGHVTLGQIREQQGRLAAARAAYETLLARWQEAEPAVLLWQEANAAVARVTR